MSEVHERPTPTQNERLVVDSCYVLEQASEAVALFFTPVSIIFRVLTGRKTRMLASQTGDAASS